MDNKYKIYIFLFLFTIFFSIYFYRLNIKRESKWIVDEIYHIKQSIVYSKNYYSFYLKGLTTFPGPFLITGFLYKILGLSKDISNLKSILRISDNNLSLFVFYGRILILIYFIFNAYLYSKFESKTIIFFMVVTLMPVQFYFHLVLYTENFSLLFLTIFLYYSIYYKSTKLFIISLILDIVTVLMRQTNIAFINFIPLSRGLELLFSLTKEENRNIKEFIKKAFNILIDNFDILISDILFITFVYYNEGFVLGDKSHHVAHINLNYVHHLLLNIFILFPLLNISIFKTIKSFFSEDKTKKIIRFIIIFIILYKILNYCNAQKVGHFFNMNKRHFRKFYYTKYYRVTKYKYISMYYLTLLFSSIFANNEGLLCEPSIISWFVCSCLTLIPENFVTMRYIMPCIILLCLILNDLNNKGKYEDIFNLMFNKFNIVYFILLDALVGDFMIIGTLMHRHGNMIF